MDHRWFPFQPLGAGVDFVIFGMGLGATLVVLGWFWRTLGPRFRHQPGSNALLSGEQMVERISWTRFCRSGGFVWIMGGCLLLFAALASLLLHLSDHTGALVVLAAFGIVALGIIAWLGAYLRRFGLIGLVVPREPTPVSAPRATPARPAARPVPRRKQPQPASATIAPVQGPPVPAGPAGMAVAGPPVPATVTETAGPGQERETVEAPRQTPIEPEAASAEAVTVSTSESDETETPPTIIGAGSRDEQPAAPQRGATDAPGEDTPASAPGDETAAPAADTATVPEQGTPDQPDTTVDAAGDTATNVERATDTSVTSRLTAPPSAPARERRFDSAAFRESIARQEAHLAQAGGGRARVDEESGQTAPVASEQATNQRAGNERGGAQRRYPAPRGAEGVQWVRDDGSGRIPGGFPIKGDPATRLYYPATAENYAQVTARYFFASARDAENAGYRQATPPRRPLTGPDRRRPVARTLATPSGATTDTVRTPATRPASHASNHPQVDHDNR